ncbi:MAG: hypothetical protein WC393_01295 [Candidatus Nanoarchaeia archaeon]|jgi:hypothetical protein
MTNKGITVNELFQGIYNSLIKKNKHEKINFSEKVYAEIADDSDWHRTRTGEMIYENASLCTFNNQQYLIALGLKTAGYPADKYSCDLTAIKISNKNIAEEGLMSILEQSTYFKNSLMHGLNDGNIGLVKNNYGEKLFNIIKEKTDEIIAQEPEYNPNYIDLSTLGAVCTKSIKYKKEAINLITDSIEKILKEEN